jgi:hypothetical protein
LRADVINGRPRPEGIAALRYHGMLQGLAILLRTPPLAIPVAPVPVSLAPGSDHAFVRLLANLVLQTHSELTHVC